jgi:hypothetical protein
MIMTKKETGNQTEAQTLNDAEVEDVSGGIAVPSDSWMMGKDDPLQADWKVGDPCPVCGTKMRNLPGKGFIGCPDCSGRNTNPIW